MSIEQIVAFNIALLASIVSPGPAFLVAVRTSLSAGRAAGMAIGCGLGLMASSWTLMALLGLQGIFQLFPWFYVAGKIAGALYLLYIAWNTWKHAKAPIESEIRPTGHAFRQGFLINLLNPKSVLFASAMLIVIFPMDLMLIEKTFIAANHLVVELIFYGCLAFAMTTPAVSRQYLRAKRHLDRFAALVLGALGLRLLIGR